MSDRSKGADTEGAEWRPLAQPADVTEWVGFTDLDGDDDLLVANLPTPLERLRRAWRAAWEIEQEVGTAFVVAPLAFACGIIAYFTVPAEPSRWVTLPLLLAAAAFLRRRTGRTRIAGCAVLLALAGFAIAQVRVASVATPTLSRPTVGFVTGRVLWTERKPDGAVRYTLAIERFEGKGEVELRGARITVRKAHVALPPNERLRLRTRLVPPSGPVTPGGYDFAFYAWFTGRGADGIGLGVPERLARPSALHAPTVLARWRYAIGERISASMDGRTGPLARALIIGDRSGIDDETAESLRASGLAHILAISGLHMMLVTGLVFASLRKACATLSVGSQRHAVKKYAAAGALAFGTVYLVLSGLNVSTQRAYVMVCVMLLAVFLDRRALTLHNVAIAAFVVLALQPEAVFSPGFQMSFGAATALITAYAALLRWKRDREETGGPIASGMRWLAGLSFTSLIAGFATAPFAAFHFHRIAAYGLVANLLAMPIVTFLVMPLAVVSVLAMPFGADAWVLPMLGRTLDVVADISTTVSAWNGWARSGHVGAAAFLASVAGFCTLALLRTWLRLFGVVPLGVALLAYAGQAEPRILLHQDGRNAAIVGDAPVLFAGKPDSFVNKLFAEAHRPAGFNQASKATCDRLGCAARMDKGWLVLSRRPGGLADDCRNAAILVAWTAKPCSAAGPRPLVVSRQRLRERGSAAIYDRGARLAPDRRWRVVHAYGAAPRPWTVHRYPSGSGE